METRSRRIAQQAPGRVDGRGARSDVLVVGEVVEEVTHNQVEVAVAVPVVEHRHRVAEHVHRRLVLQPHDLRRAPLLHLGVTLGGSRSCATALTRLIPYPIHVSVYLPVLPVAVFVVGVVPAVLHPVANADDQVVLAVTVIVGETPHVAAHAVVVDVLGQVLQRLESLPSRLGEVPRDLVLAQHRDAPVGIGLGGDVAAPLPHLLRGLEDWRCVLRPLRRRVLEVPGAAPGGDAPVGDDEVKVAVAVIVERHRIADESGLEVGRRTRVVVAQRGVVVRTLRVKTLVREGLPCGAQAHERRGPTPLRRAVERFGEVQQVAGSLHARRSNCRLAGVGVPRDDAARVVRETRLAVHECGGKGVLDGNRHQRTLRRAGDQVD